MLRFWRQFRVCDTILAGVLIVWMSGTGARLLFLRDPGGALFMAEEHPRLGLIQKEVHKWFTSLFFIRFINKKVPELLSSRRQSSVCDTFLAGVRIVWMSESMPGFLWNLGGGALFMAEEHPRLGLMQKEVCK